MCEVDLKISKIDEENNTIFISPVTLASDFYVTLNKCRAGQGSVFCEWLFLCNDSMSLAVRERFLILIVICRLQSNAQRICRRQRQHK